jgi:ribosome-associated heat shock protein Hsp15
MRLDKWLWFTRLFASRSEARNICESRHLRLDGRVIERSASLVRQGSIISFPKGRHVIAVRVEGLPGRRGPAAEARGFYTALLPAPSAHLAAHPGFAARPDTDKELAGCGNDRH